VLDCWFESGAMPYAQNHYPFENKEFFESHFPADFINEGLDQTRGWFYTLTILAAALFKRPAFKHCIVSGLVLAQDGKKMSKSLRNYTDPMDAVNEFGADALRLFLIHSAVVKADDLRYSDEGVREVLKSIIIPLWNAYGFFVTYANIDGITVGSGQWVVDSARSDSTTNSNEDSTVHSDLSDKNTTHYSLSTAHSLDRWIISAAQSLIREVSAALDAYDLAKATEPLVAFINDLNNWYIRRSRRRFWRAGLDDDKRAAYAALYRALRTLTAVASPFMPFTTEAIYRNLRGADEPLSVHLCDWPAADAALVDRDLEFRMATVMRAVQAGRALRSRENIKVRQPLRLVELVTRDAAERAALAGMLDIVAEELNVKEARLGEREEELVEYQAKANFRILGKELGASMRAAADAIAALPASSIAAILDGGSVPLEVDGKRVMLTSANVEVQRTEKAGLKVLNEGSLTVALDTTITEDLLREGIVRDLVRGIQNIRKEAGFDVSDRIRLGVSGSAGLKAAFDLFHDFIAEETLASVLTWSDTAAGVPVDCSGEEARVEIVKV
jgi:isoleucyl-tRNA synthetase